MAFIAVESRRIFVSARGRSSEISGLAVARESDPAGSPAARVHRRDQLAMLLRGRARIAQAKRSGMDPPLWMGPLPTQRAVLVGIERVDLDRTVARGVGGLDARELDLADQSRVARRASERATIVRLGELAFAEPPAQARLDLERGRNGGERRLELAQARFIFGRHEDARSERIARAIVVLQSP